MLEQLFGSRTRTKLLKLFLTNPDEAFFIRELTRKIDTQINSVRRELKNLLDAGVLIELPQEEVDRAIAARKASMPMVQEEDELDEELSPSDRQLKKYFKVNLDFPLYLELRALFLKSPLLFRKKIANEIEQYGTVDYASMMGYFVGDDTTQIDILIIGEVNKPRFTKLIAEFEQELEREINYTIMSTQEYKYRKSVTDRFLFKLIESKKIELVNNLVH